MTLINPSTLDKWLPPHSLEWYKQLSDLQGKYTYSWNSTLTEPNGESIFDDEVKQMIAHKNVLDVGCGHGDFTYQCSFFAEEIIGFDVTENFVRIGKEGQRKNLSFVVGNTKEGLPFEADTFDVVYNRKGPTSAYPSIRSVLKKGGKVIGLHPGDELGKELPFLFPDLFEKSQGTPFLDTIHQRLGISDFANWEVEVLNSMEYLHTPLDVIKVRCFGQDPEVYETVKNENLTAISKIFEQNTTEKGLPITYSRYLVRASV